MNFLTIFNNQIEEQKQNVEREHNKYHLFSNIDFFLSEKERLEYKEYFNSTLNKKHNDNLFHYIENTFLFKNQLYDKSFFISLKDQFIDNIIDNKETILSLYQSKPIELVLVSYFHYTQQNINQEQLFNFIKVIIENNNPVEFLTKFSFVSDYDMHYFVISFIELKNQEMSLHKNTPTTFFKYIYTYFHFNKNKIPNSLFTDLFYVYLNNKMYESSKLLSDKFSHNFTEIRIKDSLDLITKDNINDDYFERFAQLSLFDFKYSFSNHLDFISENLTNDFFTLNKKNNSFLFFKQKDKYFTFQFSKNIQLKNSLYTIYKNIILKKINYNKKLNSQEIKLLMQIYCISNSLFSNEEQFFILNYLKKCSLFQDIIKQQNYLNIVFLFFSFYNNFNYFEYILENNYQIIKEIINVNYELLNQQVYNILIKYSNLESFTPIFKNILQYFISSNYFINFNNDKSTRELMINNVFEENAQKIIDIDINLFESLIDDKNKIIFEEVYIKKTIANF